MEVRLVRHATLRVEYANVRFLIDPLLGPRGSQPPIPDTGDERLNPLVELPVPADRVVAGIDVVMVTHLHPDHIDATALELITNGIPVLCQPGDAPMLRRAGLSGVRPVDDVLEVGRVRIERTGGRHGHGAIGAEMGAVSGFVLAAEGEPTLYVAGDTVWCDEVAEVLARREPDVVVVNAGEARFVAGEPITMGVPDVVAVCAAAPEAVVVAVHMEAINHCGLPRAALLAGVAANGHEGRVHAPADGVALQITAAG